MCFEETTTSYELPELGVASGIDASTKLVTDSNEILLGNQAHNIQPTITLSSWPQDLLTSELSSGDFATDSGLVTLPKVLEENIKPPTHGPITMPVLATPNGTTFIQPVIINTQHKQLNNFNNYTIQTRAQQMAPRGATINVRPQVQQVPFMAPTNTQNFPGSSAFTLRFPLPATIGKGVQLHLIAKGQNSFPVTENTSTVHNYERIPISNDICEQVAQQSGTGSGIILFKDKTTGKNYIVPTGPASVVLNPSGNVPVSQATFQQQTTAVNTNETCISPTVDVLGNNDPYGDLGIAEPQPIIDVNEFLNIPPPKEMHTEKVVMNNEAPVVTASVSDVNVKSTVQETHLGQVSLPITTSEKSDDVSTETSSKSNEIPKPVLIVVSKYFNSKESTKESQSNTGDHCQGKDNLEEDTTSITNEISNAATGEDLIKMMALRKNKKDEESVKQTSGEDVKGTGMQKKNDQEESDVNCEGLFNESEISIALPNEGGEMDTSIVETEQRIASIVPDSMKVLTYIRKTLQFLTLKLKH